MNRLKIGGETMALLRSTFLISMVAAFQLAVAQPPPGTRIVHYSASANVVGSRVQFVPRAGGGFTITGSNQKFNLEAHSGGGGHGYTVVDIVYADGETCVGSLMSFGMDGLTGALSVLGYSGFATRGSCSDFWQPQEQLAALTPQLGEVTIVRGPVELAGMTLDTVGIGTTRQDATNNMVYDLATGLLVFADTATGGGPVPTPGPGNTVLTGQGSTFMTHSKLLTARPLPLPAMNPTLPDHVRNVSALDYDCYTQMTFMGTSMGLRCGHEVRVVARGSGWLSLKVLQSTEDPITMIPDQFEYDFVLANSQLFGYYMAPELAAALQPGTVIDEDPVTGARTSVRRVDDQVVVLDLSLPSETTSYVYDRASGWLVEVYRSQQVGGAVTEWSMQLVNVR